MTVLDRILASRRTDLDALRAEHTEGDLAAAAERAPEVRDFRAALTGDGLSVIAEIKRASPSRGDLCPGLDPARTALAYATGGAHALSVLTESAFFKGSPDDLATARAAVDLPVLWKDFVLDPLQVTWARSVGADAVLVIVRILDDATVEAVIDRVRAWGMTPLVEAFDECDVTRALDAGADVVGLNQRDLQTFQEDPTAAERLRPMLGDDVVCVAASAISTREQARRLERLGVDAVLVGEALVRSKDPADTIRELRGRT